MNLLAFQDVAKKYRDIEALRGIDLEIEEGSILALLGPNGAGKSTLFGCLLGTVAADRGEIRFRGQPVTAVLRRRFGFLAERVALYPQRTVWENAVYFGRLKGNDLGAVRRALDRVAMGDLLQRKVAELSKGQLQRAGLGIALAGEPELLVLDEPFNGLDPVVLETLLKLLREERRRGATLLISTHTISAAEEIATHAAILLDGKISLTGRIEALRESFPRQTLESIYHHIAKSRVKPLEEVAA